MGAASVTQTTFTSSNHSGRLRYANAEDLPSYPSTGLRKDGAAAGAAASLGWANRTSFEHWKPDSSISTSASTAALLANANEHSRMAPVKESHSHPSSAGSQAAILAAGSAQRHQHRQSLPPSIWGNSAANLAFKASRTTPPPNTDTQSLSRKNSMSAAKGAMANTRPRSKSSPQTPQDSYPDQANAASNALSAATIAHRPAVRAVHAPVGDAGAIPYTTMNRLMFTSHPPVKIETDEKNRADVLHASAVAMAKRMYTQQQKVINNTKHARSSSFTRHGSGSPTAAEDDEPQPMPFNNLQEAAFKLAQERLAKIHDEHQKNRDYQEYYGSPGVPQRSKLGTLRNKLTRRRSSSDGDLINDQQRSQQIRKQMSMFDTKLMEVDEKKRTQDRQALLATAQKNVRARLQDMDDKLNAQTGRMPQSIIGDWEVKAHAAAQARFDASRNDNYGKIDLGGGKFMDRDEVDDIAARKVQPLLDEINENAERERERRVQQALEEERAREEAERDRLREKEIQDNLKRIKEHQKDVDKARKAEIKQEGKARKEEAKAAKAEEKRQAKDVKQKEKEVVPVVPVLVPAGTESEKGAEENRVEEKSGTTLKSPVLQPTEPEPEQTATTTTTAGGGRSKALSISFPKISRHQHKEKDKEPSATSPPADNSINSDGEPSTSPTNKVKSWLKTRFQRPRAKSSSTALESSTTPGLGKGFIGGASLAKLASPNASTHTIENRSASMHEVAMAGRRKSDEPAESSAAGAGAVSPLSIAEAKAVGGTSTISSLRSGNESDSSLDHFEEARTEAYRPATPPALIIDSPGRKASPLRGSRFSEILE
ncbi:hypothetical protein B0T22DRAFT_234742 [Podospora appendiculata]|uniref:Eisosome protein 1 n=1 Tax=Podospora appendiculata TaxID=314037 RepID=A0AAE1C6Y7_9PEZI|nr:hypothetical protein B0T22DRAFT_119207 [Podospora appendiculata]KAK3685916.1 hypothetical protein B0T22DRAFT_234742 [Podospora appendiculata]